MFELYNGRFVLAILLALGMASGLRAGDDDDDNRGPCGIYGKSKTWYIKADAAPDGDGSKKEPFADFTEAQLFASEGDTLKLLASDVPVDGGVTLKDCQRLVGESRKNYSSITNSTDIDSGLNNGSGVVLANHNTVAYLDIRETEGSGILAADKVGSKIHHVDITNPNNAGGLFRGVIAGVGASAHSGILLRNVCEKEDRFPADEMDDLCVPGTASDAKYSISHVRINGEFPFGISTWQDGGKTQLRMKHLEFSGARQGFPNFNLSIEAIDMVNAVFGPTSEIEYRVRDSVFDGNQDDGFGGPTKQISVFDIVFEGGRVTADIRDSYFGDSGNAQYFAASNDGRGTTDTTIKKSLFDATIAEESIELLALRGVIFFEEPFNYRNRGPSLNDPSNPSSVHLLDLDSSILSGAFRGIIAVGQGPLFGFTFGVPNKRFDLKVSNTTIQDMDSFAVVVGQTAGADQPLADYNIDLGSVGTGDDDDDDDGAKSGKNRIFNSGVADFLVSGNVGAIQSQNNWWGGEDDNNNEPTFILQEGPDGPSDVLPEEDLIFEPVLDRDPGFRGHDDDDD